MADYRDPKPIVPTEPNYTTEHVNPLVKGYAKNVREKMYGKDVRESIARAIEVSGEESGNSLAWSLITKDRQDFLEHQFNDVVANVTVDSEVILSRRSRKLDKAFTTLYERLDSEDLYFVTPLMFGAKGDGMTDDSDAIQEAFNTKLPVLIPHTGKPFIFTKPLKAFNDIVFMGWLKRTGADGARDSSAITLEDLENVTVTNPLIDGGRDVSKPFVANDKEYSHGLNIIGCTNTRVIGGVVKNNFGDNIAIGPSNKNRFSENTLISGTFTELGYRNEIAIISGKKVLIEGTITINRNGYRNILIEPNQDSTLVNDEITVRDFLMISSNPTAAFEACSNRKIGSVYLIDGVIDISDGKTTCPIRTAHFDADAGNIVGNWTVKGVKVLSDRGDSPNQQFLVSASNKILFRDVSVHGKLRTGVFNGGDILFDNYAYNDKTQPVYTFVNFSYLKVINSQFTGVNATSQYSGALSLQPNHTARIHIAGSDFINVTNAISLTSKEEIALITVYLNVSDCVFRNSDTYENAHAVNLQSNIHIPNLTGSGNTFLANMKPLRVSGGKNNAVNRSSSDFGATKFMYPADSNGNFVHNPGDVSYFGESANYYKYIGQVCIKAGLWSSNTWKAKQAYTEGQTVTAGPRVYKCIVKGTSGDTMPSNGDYGTSADGSVTWQHLGAAAEWKKFGALE